MSDLEFRLRRDLKQRAAATPIPAGPPGDLVDRVARRRRARMRACVAAVPLVVGLLALPAVWNRQGDRIDIAAGSGDPAGDLPSSKPELSGSVVANVDTNPCDTNTPGRECVNDVVRFHLGSPETLERLPTGDWSRVEVLADGRYVERDGSQPQLSVLVDPGGAPPLPLGKDARSVDLLQDRRLVLLATDDAGRSVIRTIDERTGSVEDRPVPSAVHNPTAVTGGPNGALAVVGKGGRCSCALRDLVVIAADGREQHRRLSTPERTGTPFVPAISWGPGGLLAVTNELPDPLAAAFFENRRAPERDVLHPGWTDVYDVRTGDLVVSLDGWQGLAWAPDGRGLLTARRDGERASQLAVWWGPGLARRLDLGRSPLPLMPRYWSPA